MKKFKEFDKNIKALIIMESALAFVFVVIFIFFFVSYMDSSIGANYKELTNVQLPKKYQAKGPFKKYEILNSEMEDYGRDVLYQYIRVAILTDEEASHFEEEIQTAKEWQPVSSLLPEEKALLQRYNASAQNAYFVASSRPLDSDDLRFILYNLDTHEIIFLLLN